MTDSTPMPSTPRGRGRPRKTPNGSSTATSGTESKFKGNQYTMRRQHLIQMSEAFVAGYTLGEKSHQQQK